MPNMVHTAASRCTGHRSSLHRQAVGQSSTQKMVRYITRWLRSRTTEFGRFIQVDVLRTFPGGNIRNRKGIPNVSDTLACFRCNQMIYKSSWVYSFSGVLPKDWGSVVMCYLWLFALHAGYVHVNIHTYILVICATLRRDLTLSLCGPVQQFCIWNA